MFVVGEFVNTNIVNKKRGTMELEKYCRDEGLCSIQLRRDASKLYSMKRKKFFKNLLVLVKKIIKYRRNRLLS